MRSRESCGDFPGSEDKAFLQQRANRYQTDRQVRILDGGTLGLDLVYYLEGVENLLLIDAVQAGLEPGGLLRLEGEEVPAFLSMKISPHEIRVPDMLSAARLLGVFPNEIVLLGIQPQRVEIGLSLSDPVTGQVDNLVGLAVEQLDRWGHTLQPAQLPEPPRSPGGDIQDWQSR